MSAAETIGPEDANLTRRSLVSRLRQWDDHSSWQEFFNTYWRLIYSVAIKSGLSDQEAEDVVQETVLSVAKKMGDFRYDRSVCTFKGWLMHLTRLRVKDQLRKRPPAGVRLERRRTLTGTGTDTMGRIPDTSGTSLEALWNEEWEKNIAEVAMARVRERVRPVHYQMFYLNAVKEMSAAKVAALFGVTTARVYLVKHRVAAQIQKEVRRLERKGSRHL